MHIQMCGEKLVKAYVRQGGPVPFTHAAVGSWYAHVKASIVGSQVKRNSLMGRPASRGQVNTVLASLEKTLLAVEALNPSVARRLSPHLVGGAPNCEYPWETPGPPPTGHPPVKHKFGSKVSIPARAKVYRVLDRILTMEQV